MRMWNLMFIQEIIMWNTWNPSMTTYFTIMSYSWSLFITILDCPSYVKKKKVLSIYGETLWSSWQSCWTTPSDWWNEKEAQPGYNLPEDNFGRGKLLELQGGSHRNSKAVWKYSYIVHELRVKLGLSVSRISNLQVVRMGRSAIVIIIIIIIITTTLMMILMLLWSN